MKRVLSLIILLLASTIAIQAQQVTINSQTIPNWQGAANVELRIYALESFLDALGNPVQAGSPFDLRQAKWHAKVICTVSGTTLTCPSIAVTATETSLDKPNTARLGAYLFDLNSRLIGPYSVFDSFRLPASPTTTTWAAIRAHNVGVIPPATVNYSLSGNLYVGGNVTAGYFNGYIPLRPSNNLSDLSSASTARNNLGLGNLATQNASSVTGPVNVTGTLTATNLVGNGAGITGLAGATGGVSNTGSTSIIADSDQNGAGVVDQIVGVETITRASANKFESFKAIEGPLQDKGGAVYNVAAYGITGAAHGGSPSDESAALLTLLTTVYNAGGGKIQFNARKYRFDSRILLPNDGASTPAQPALKLVGAGASHNGEGGVPFGGTILDLRYSGSPAKIDTRGLGYLEIEGISFVDEDSSDTTPFLQTTLTTLSIHNTAFRGRATGAQDAIVLGGTSTTISGAATAPFQGYGTVIRDNYFDRLRRAVYGRVYANAITVRDNTIWSGAGADNTAAAIEFDGQGVSVCSGNVISGNLIEMSNYVYGIKLKDAVHTSLDANNFYDEGGDTLAYIRFEPTAVFNTIIAGFGDDTIPMMSDAAGNNTIFTGHQSQTSYLRQPFEFDNNVTFTNGWPVTKTSNGQYQQMEGAAGNIFQYFTPTGGSLTSMFDVRLSGNNRYFTLPGTANNYLSGGGNNLYLQSGGSGSTLWLEDTAGHYAYLANGLFRVPNQIFAGGSNDPAATPVVARGAASQTAKILDVQDNGGTTLFAVPAAGGVQLPGGATWTVGSGAPTGFCTTASIYTNLTGGTGTTLYVCESNAWAAK